MTVSVATGHIEYHLLYLSIGNLHHTAHCGHQHGVVPIAFLAIPKSKPYTSPGNFEIVNSHLRPGKQKYDNDPTFQKFKR